MNGYLAAYPLAITTYSLVILAYSPVIPAKAGIHPSGFGAMAGQPAAGAGGTGWPGMVSCTEPR